MRAVISVGNRKNWLQMSYNILTFE